MPDEVFVLSMVAILSGAIVILGVVWSIIAYLRWRTKSDDKVRGDASLTASELKRIMQAAVEDATHPLFQRMDRIEERLAETDRPDRLTANETRRLEAAASEPAQEEQEGRRSTSRRG